MTIRVSYRIFCWEHKLLKIAIFLITPINYNTYIPWYIIHCYVQNIRTCDKISPLYKWNNYVKVFIEQAQSNKQPMNLPSSSVRCMYTYTTQQGPKVNFTHELQQHNIPDCNIVHVKHFKNTTLTHIKLHWLCNSFNKCKHALMYK